MGRRRIPIKAIKDPKTKQLTFMKRLEGLLKKTMELSILCDSQICLLVMGQGGEMLHYGSVDPLDLCRQYEELRVRPELHKAFEAHPHLTNFDYSDIFINQQHARALSRDRLLSVPKAYPTPPTPSSPSPSSSSAPAPPSALGALLPPHGASALPSSGYADPAAMVPLAGMAWPLQQPRAAPLRAPPANGHAFDEHWDAPAAAPSASPGVSARAKRKLNIDIPYPTHMSLPEQPAHDAPHMPLTAPSPSSSSSPSAAAPHPHLFSLPPPAAGAQGQPHAHGGAAMMPYMAGVSSGGSGGAQGGAAGMGYAGLASPSAAFPGVYWGNAAMTSPSYPNFFAGSGMISPTSLGLGGGLFGVSPEGGKRMRTFEGGGYGGARAHGEMPGGTTQ